MAAVSRYIVISAISAVGLSAVLSGCTTPKVDNPVMFRAPRRIVRADSDLANKVFAKVEADSKSAEGEIQTASATDDAETGDGSPDEIFNARVVARVNGTAIFAGDILTRYRPYLAAAQKKVSRKDFERGRDQIIRQELPNYIIQAALVERLKSSLTKDQIKQANQHVDGLFEKEVAKLKRELKVSSRTELERALNERGTSLAERRMQFGNEILATNFLQEKIERPGALTRADLLRYYRDNQEEFEMPATVAWLEIAVMNGETGGRDKARLVIEQAMAELEKGVPFEKVMAEYSSKGHGGEHIAMRQSSFKDQALGKLAFDLDEGEYSDIYEAGGGFSIILITERQYAGRRTFEEVQGDIEAKLSKDTRGGKQPQDIIREVIAGTAIESEMYPDLVINMKNAR